MYLILWEFIERLICIFPIIFTYATSQMCVNLHNEHFNRMWIIFPFKDFTCVTSPQLLHPLTCCKTKCMKQNRTPHPLPLPVHFTWGLVGVGTHRRSRLSFQVCLCSHHLATIFCFALYRLLSAPSIRGVKSRGPDICPSV